MKISLKKKLIICSILSVILIFAWQWLNTWEFKKALPFGAYEVYEWIRQESLLPDYAYFLKARISKEQFQDYLAALEMKDLLHTSTSKYEDGTAGLNWSPSMGVDQSIWDPSPDLTETYVWQKGHEWVLVKYENGYVFLKALNH